MHATIPTLLTALLLAAPAARCDDAEAALRVVRLDGTTVDAATFTADGGGLVLGDGEGRTRVDFADLLEATCPDSRPGGAEDTSLTVEAELVNGDVLRGELGAAEGETGFRLRSRCLGELVVPLDNVARLRFVRNLLRSEDPVVLEAAQKSDRFLFASGDRLEGTLRSVAHDGIRVRTEAGVDRTLPVDDLVGFALVPFPPREAKGVRVRVDLEDGCRVSGAFLTSLEDGRQLVLKGMLDSRDREFAVASLRSVTARGGRGVVLSDITPMRIEVKPYWGDDPVVLHHRPRYDRAFTLAPGPEPALHLGGRRYARGVSVFSGTTLVYEIEGKGYRRFTASVGVDDAGPAGEVEFEVLADGKSLWRSGPLGTVARGASPTTVPPVDLEGVDTLELRVHAGPGDDVQDYADWVGAAFHR